MYDVKSYRSTDGINIDTQIFTLACDAGARSTYSSTTFEYVVDRGYDNTNPVDTGPEVWSDPVAAQIELRDERLAGAEYAVFFRGIGQRRDDEYIDRTDAGELFNSGDTIFVTVQNRVDANGGDSGSDSGSGEVTDVILIDIDTDFDAATMNQKLLFADGASTDLITLAFPNLSILSDCTFKVSTHGGLQRYFALQLDAGDEISFRGDLKNVIYLGQGEDISLMVRSNSIYILEDGTGYRQLGQRVWGDKLELNTIYRDGSTYDQADYPRLMEFIDSLASVLSYASWATDKGKFARDDIAGTFKVPDDRNKFIRSLQYTDGTTDSERTTQGVGGKQANQNKEHGHGIATTNGSPSGNNTADPVRGTIAGTLASSQGIEWTTGGDTKTIRKSGGAESRPDNVGLLPLIYI
jgi:hypothetical protein